MISFPNAIVFDCDGVLLETVRAKLEAFSRWVPSEHLARKADFEKYNRAAFGLSREVQIRHFYKGIVGVSSAEEFIAAEIARFGDICRETVKDASWTPGAMEFLDLAFRRGIPLFVLSGTPQLVLEAELGNRQAAHLFKAIYGAPNDKATTLKKITREIGGAPERIWMVGDGRVDFIAAQDAGVSFIFRESELGNIEGDFHRIDVLSDLKNNIT